MFKKCNFKLTSKERDRLSVLCGFIKLALPRAGHFASAIGTPGQI